MASGVESASETEPLAVAAPAPSGKHLYAAAWRWHFYAGLLTAPVLWVIAVTGALYAFRTELTTWRDRDLLFVQPQPTRLSYDTLREIVARETGSTELDGVLVYSDPARSVCFVTEVDVEGGHEGEHQHRMVFLDPYTGAVLGTQIKEADFFSVVLDLHRSLMLGATGRVLGELATSWTLVLFATGVYLWWPRGKANAGVWLPRLSGKAYSVLRDWHAVGGAYLLPLTLVIAGTGMFFTIVWGSGFNRTAREMGHWPPQWLGVPKNPAPHPGAAPASLDSVVATCLAQTRGPDDQAMIRVPPSPGIAYKAFLMRDEDKNSLRMVTVDQHTAKQLLVLDVRDLPAMYQTRVLAVSIHQGQILGTTTKVLAVLACVAILALSVTGLWMWVKRRPTGRTGFPRRPVPRAVPKWGWAVVVAGGVLLPVAGASMLLIGLVDWSVIRFRGRVAAGAA